MSDTFCDISSELAKFLKDVFKYYNIYIYTFKEFLHLLT